MRIVIAFLVVIFFTAVFLSYHTVRQFSRLMAKRCEADLDLDTFVIPKEFLFGASTSAYQIEGAWNEDGKGVSIWDAALHKNPGVIKDRMNGDVTADSYHHYKDDVAALKKLGFNFYRFSIAWTRIMPNGAANEINYAGIQYYHRVIDELLANDIQPVITMYHLDLPQKLQEMGGWTNPIIVQYYEAYADVLFQNFGDKIKRWITFNEPFDSCIDAYGRGILPPFIHGEGVAEYLCGHHILISHATAYHLYKKKYSHYGGKIGITLNSRYFIPKDGKDSSLTERGMQYMLGWFAHPILSATGGYPSIMVNEIAENSLLENRTTSRLPFMDTRLKLFIRNTADYLSFNYYTSNIVEFNENFKSSEPSWDKDSRLILSFDSNWKKSANNWVYNVPKGMYRTLKWIYDQFDNPEILITENGWSDQGQLKDDDRIDYLRRHLLEVMKVKECIGANIIGYGIWSLLDNFEWLSGFTEHFGLYAVNMTSPNKERIPKKSAMFMQKVVQTRTIPKNYEN
ncbi:myrosinase 1-like [Culicoides brevitarsis]|uniref:myrosinase 1-like n=1 Tax=Culicoides brevitarsis TaxID=469753 RepID=UPI00307B5EFE